MITVTAIQCPKCLDIIYSRARHDFHYCGCGEVAVDGGFDYLKMSFKKTKPVPFQLAVDASCKYQLFRDWNTNQDVFGVIRIQNKLKKKKS